DYVAAGGKCAVGKDHAVSGCGGDRPVKGQRTLGLSHRGDKVERRAAAQTNRVAAAEGLIGSVGLQKRSTGAQGDTPSAQRICRAKLNDRASRAGNCGAAGIGVVAEQAELSFAAS